MTPTRAEPAPPDGSRPRRLFVVGSLYLVANVGYSFVFLTLGTILLSRGVPLGTVATVNLLGAVYFGRFLLAPVVDRFGSTRFGHYRGWLLLTQVGLVATLVGLASVDPVRQLPVLVAVLAVLLVLSMLHDTALGGLTVRLLPESDHGIGNGVQFASASASVLLGSSGALFLYAKAGWTVTVLALAVVFVLPFAVLLGLTEPVRECREPAPPWRQLVAFFRRGRMAAWTLLVIPVFAVSEWLATAPQPAMLLAAGWRTDEIALAQSAATGVQVVATVAAGAAVTRYGRTRPALVLGVLGVAAVTAVLPLATGYGAAVPTTLAMVAVSVVYGAKVTWVAAVTMSLANPATAATDYAVPLSVEGVCVTVVSSAGLALAGAVGFPWLVALAVTFAVAGAVVTPLWVSRVPGEARWSRG